MANLDRLAEIELPLKRAAIVVYKNAAQLTVDEKFLLIFNLSPGTSVSVIDLAKREFVGEIATPGCSLVYPTHNSDFFMLCGDGSLLNIALDDKGAERSRSRSQPFIDIDADPLSEKASKVGDRWHFISFAGDVQPIASNRKRPRIEARWSTTTDVERAANWRPAGWHGTAAHPDNKLWVGMTPKGYEGSHKDPAPEVWLFDTKKHKRLGRIKMRTPALSIDVTLEDQPRLLVVNIEGALDVYDAFSGEYLRSIYDLGASPYQVHRVQ
jgi:methylamine dehydrogenase heavy chain